MSDLRTRSWIHAVFAFLTLFICLPRDLVRGSSSGLSTTRWEAACL